MKASFINIHITELRAKDFIICSKKAKRDPNIIEAFSSKYRRTKTIAEERVKLC
jgi:hypothetical protein